MVVSDWSGQRVLAEVKGDPAVTFHTACQYSSSAKFNFVTAGDKFIRLWSLNGRNLTSNKVGYLFIHSFIYSYFVVVYFYRYLKERDNNKRIMIKLN